MLRCYRYLWQTVIDGQCHSMHVAVCLCSVKGCYRKISHSQWTATYSVTRDGVFHVFQFPITCYQRWGISCVSVFREVQSFCTHIFQSGWQTNLEAAVILGAQIYGSGGGQNSTAVHPGEGCGFFWYSHRFPPDDI